tara:strand:+ start:11601 stop:15116 length:3516 start_codon:yes stop_codon:yes gene_type:complete
MSQTQQNRLQLGNQEVVFAVTRTGGATVSTAEGKELAINVQGGGITMVQKDPSSGAETSIDMKAKFESIDNAVAANQGDGTAGISKDIDDATTARTAVEQRLDDFETDITTFHKKYNTQTDSTANPPTVADPTSVHITQHAAIDQLVEDRTTNVEELDTKLGDHVDFTRDAGQDADDNPVNSNSRVELTKAVDAMRQERIADVAELTGSTADKLKTDVTDVVQAAEDHLTELFRACEGILCREDSSEILKNIINDINTADVALREEITNFSRETYALAGDLKGVVSTTAGVTATIDSPSLQGTATPRLEGTLQMETGRSFYLFFNSVAFDITPADSTAGPRNWVLDFSDEQNPPSQKQVHPDEVLVVRAGVNRLGDRNDIAIIEYAGDEKALTQIAVVQKLVVDTLGPAISIGAIVPPARLQDMDAFTISGSVGEVGVKVEMIHEDGQKWEVTTGQDGEYSFSPYVDVPASGGTVLPKVAQNLVYQFRLESTDALGNKSVTGDLTWTVNLDVAVEEFTFTTGPKYTSVRPTFSGTADAGSTVSLPYPGPYSGQTLEATAGSDKTWSITIPEDEPALDEGQVHTLRFTATDPAGNSRSEDHTVKVWAQAPAFGSTSAVITSSRGYSFTGEVTPAAGQEFGGVSSVELIVEDSNGTVLSDAGSLTHSGVTLSGMLSLPETDGDYVMKWVATNNFGLSATVSTAVTLDTTAPSLVMTAQPQLDKTKRIKVGGTWSNPGSTEIPAITVEIEGVIYKAGTVAKHTGGDSTGVWECVLQTDSGEAGTVDNGATPISFVDKTYSVTATVTDGADNTGSTAGSMVVDSTAPTLSLDSTPGLQNDGTQYEVRISLTEAALKSLTLGVSDQVLNLLNPSVHSGLSVSPAVQTNSASTQTIVVKPNVALADQQYQVTVSATDIYDRTTTRTTPINIDTTAPHVTLDGLLSFTTNDAIIDFSGTVSSASDTVEISYPQGDPKVNSAFIGVTVNSAGSWSLRATNVSHGTSFLRIRATDSLGNTDTTLHNFIHTAAAPLSVKGIFAPAGFNAFNNPEQLIFDAGLTTIQGVVSEFDNIEYIEASLNGESHRLEGSVLTSALGTVPQGWAPYNTPAYRTLTIQSGTTQPSYQSGFRYLFVSTAPINIVSLTVKWKDHPAGLEDGSPNWIVRQSYQPYDSNTGNGF